MLRSIVSWTLKTTAITAGLLIAYACILGEDWISSLRSPETMVGVQRLIVLEDSAGKGSYDIVRRTLPSWQGTTAQVTWRVIDAVGTKATGVLRDFDGDGVPDRMSMDNYHQEPMFSEDKSGMVMLVSGATGKVLLAYAVDCPFNRAEWCGDLDGNGTEDVLVVENDRAVVLGSDCGSPTPR